MCLLQAKAPSISKIYPTLLFLPVFIMYSHGIFTLLSLLLFTKVGKYDDDWTKFDVRKWPIGVKT